MVSTQLTRGSISAIETGRPMRFGWPSERTVVLPATEEQQA